MMMDKYSMPTTLSRRTIVGCALAGTALLGSATRAFAGAASIAANADALIVETTHGRVRGAPTRGVIGFKGIPYAGSVSGAARFKIAPPAVAWTGVRDAIFPGPPAMQPLGGTYGLNEPAYSEDCLVLNVWTPDVRDGRKRPVVFYNHGGGFLTGSGASADADGANMARDFDVVVVASNHRLGALGYLYLGDIGGAEYASSGNQGLLDIVAALQWVRQNIAAFGGDPNNVLVFGESGGGMKTSALCAMPAAKGLFHKIGIMSGPMLRATTRDDATLLTQAMLQALDIAPHDLHRLAEVPVAQLLAAQQRVHVGPLYLGPALGARSIGFAPVLDGHYLTQHPFDPAPAPWLKYVPLVIGLCRDEARFFAMASKATEVFSMTDAEMVTRVRRELGDLFADQFLPVVRASRPSATPTDLYVALTGARWWEQSIAIAERKLAQTGASVFMYRYDYESNVPIPGTNQLLGAAHATDIPACFDNGDETGLMGNRPDRPAMAHTLSAFWAGFAHHGRPHAPGQPAWPAYDLQSRATMALNIHSHVENDPWSAERSAAAHLKLADA
jgi:para-nitrobenzyl esterase